MGPRNLAPGFTPAQNQPVEQQKAICQQNKTPLCPMQCHLAILTPSCSPPGCEQSVLLVASQNDFSFSSSKARGPPATWPLFGGKQLGYPLAQQQPGLHPR